MLLDDAGFGIDASSNGQVLLLLNQPAGSQGGGLPPTSRTGAKGWARQFFFWTECRKWRPTTVICLTIESRLEARE